jgi:hypothetical protein
MGIENNGEWPIMAERKLPLRTKLVRRIRQRVGNRIKPLGIPQLYPKVTIKSNED